MEQGHFLKERLKYQPPLPEILQGIQSLEIHKGEVYKRPEAIQSLFPNTVKEPIVSFKKGEKKSHSPLKVGVILSGGQAAGGHNVIIGLFDALKKIEPQSRLFGFLGGPAGLVENRFKELEKDFLGTFLNTGGFDMIGSGRTKIESDAQLEAALKVCQTLSLDGLVIIGGDDSNTNAAVLAEYFKQKAVKTHVVGVPKTIDGDLKNNFVETSFGFDTACKIYSEMIGNIGRDALSAKKYTHFIKLMGRSASHIALECALQTHPNLTLIAEEIAAKKMTLKEITNSFVQCIVERAAQGKNYALFLIPEGLIEFIPEIKTLIKELNGMLASGGEKDVVQKLSTSSLETFSYLPKAIQEQLLLDRDPHGNVQVSHIATEQLFIHTVKKALQERFDFKGKFNPLGHFFGYEGRCGYPSNFDANYCYALGYTAAVLVANGLSGYMSAIQNLTSSTENWEPLGIPITMMMDMEERKGVKKPVIKKALVDLSALPYKYFDAERKKWRVEDGYRFPPPIQFWGPSEVCNETTITLALESKRSPQESASSSVCI